MGFATASFKAARQPRPGYLAKQGGKVIFGRIEPVAPALCWPVFPTRRETLP